MYNLKSVLYRLCEGEPNNHEWPPTLSNRAGVYQIIATDDHANVLPLNSLGSLDISGIFYIGASSQLMTQLGNFCNTACPQWDNTTGHHAAVKYNNKRALQKICPPENLHFKFEYTNDYIKLERECLALYKDKFGQHPPLNDKGGDRQ